MPYDNIREEELKNKIAQDYFQDFDCSKIIGNVDFCVIPKAIGNNDLLFETQSLLWAEAKKGKSDIINSIVQLILTIGKARTFDKQLPPAFLGAFDGFQVAFLPYNDIQEIFYVNDFNWSVTPSNYDTKEFKLLRAKVQDLIQANSLQFSYATDHSDIQNFIRTNLVANNSELSKIQIDKNNFLVIYNKWLASVKPTINFPWENGKKHGIMDSDFYLADLFSESNQTIKDGLYAVLKTDYYEVDRKVDGEGFFNSKKGTFNDLQKAHHQFWKRYTRPPKKEYWDYIIERKELLLPQDVRERKGSFFTPQIWVELSQKYLAETLGENWQDEYYIWDCAAGTGNLLRGLVNKYNIWASTLDQSDVDAMKDGIKSMNQKSLSGNGATLLESHCFQFDFLNDEFSKLPQGLQDIVNDPEKRKKLVVYINPPYAESGSGVGRGFKDKVATENKTYLKYKDKLGKASNELFAQFLIRIQQEIQGCVIGEFSTLKLLSGGNSSILRSNFLAKLEKLFIVPADTFDNVKGSFPIGFKIWNTAIKEKFVSIDSDVFDSNNNYFSTKSFYSYDAEKGRINDWLDSFKINKEKGYFGVLVADAPDFQHNNSICIKNTRGVGNFKYFYINQINFHSSSIYFAVRHVFEHTWIKHNDQFLFPNDNWKTDIEFQNDCLAFALFHSKNNIKSISGVNHWIPFTEAQVEAGDKFQSNWMTDYMNGKLEIETESDDNLFNDDNENLPLDKGMLRSNGVSMPLQFSPEAQAVFTAGQKLWQYYHQQKDINVNASLYDIREYFQGRNAAGKMNSRSENETYTILIGNLRDALKLLASQIQPKVYEYGFLRE